MTIQLDRTIWHPDPARASDDHEYWSGLAARKEGVVSADRPLLWELSGDHAQLAALALVTENPELAAGDLAAAVGYRFEALRLAAVSEDDSVEVILPDSSRRVRLAHRVPPVERGTWVHGVMAASLLERWDVVDEFTGWQTFVGDDSEAEQTRVELYRAFFASNAETSQRLIAAIDATDPAGLQGEARQYMLDRLVPGYEILAAVLARSQERFDVAVTKAHDAHVRWYSGSSAGGTPRSGDPNVAVDWTASALVRIGVASGLAEPPSSPYHVDFSPYVAR